MKKTLVILTLNEIDGLKVLFDRIPLNSADEVVCIDGGSQDGTVEFLTGRGVPVLSQEAPGRGSACRTALSRCNGDVLLFFSPDGNEDPQDIPILFERIAQGYDMVIASRFLPGGRNEEDGGLIRPRSWVNRAFSYMANFLWNTGDPVTDTINGFRALRREAMIRLNSDESGFALEYQITIRAMKLHMRIGEIPTVESPRIGGAVKARSFPVGWRHILIFLQEIINGYSFERSLP